MPDISLPVSALVETAQKRRILTKATAQRLADYAAGKGVQSLADLGAWLDSGDGLSPDLARKLKGFLPMPSVKAFGPYAALTHLADGGMGSVYLAAGKDGRSLVVIKTIKSELPVAADGTAAAEFVKRFERESRITLQLNHPNVVRAIDCGISEDKQTYMVLEYVDSGDLRDLVDLRGGLSEPLALAIMHQVADGLCEAHRLKLVHRDIKPPNIFVASDGRAKLADFGIARSTEQGRTMLTMQGAIVGSPMYMSPEQVLTDPTLDIRSDIYAMGAVLYFCLCAEPPYNGKLQEILHQHCTAPVPDVRRKRPKISDATQAIIATAMAKDRKARYAEPMALRDALAKTLDALGAMPGQAVDESTASGDLSGGTAFRPGTVVKDMRTITANLNAAEEALAATRTGPGSADQATLAANLSSDQATIAADLGADQATMAANLNADQATIAADLGGGSAPGPVTVTGDLPTVAANLNAMQTMTALLMKQEPELAAPPAPSRDPGTHATVLAGGQSTIARILAGEEPACRPSAKDHLDGDLAKALAVDWISLLPPQPVPDGPAVLLFARPRLVLGKLREAPTDLCVRNYPVAIHKDACQRISRGHCRLAYDAVQDKCVLEDLNAPNGTMLDGLTLPPGKTADLALNADNILLLAGVVTLWLHPIPRRGPQLGALDGASGAPGACGLDTGHGLDAVTITRPENRPELAYALVLRRLSLGGPGADLVLAGARTRGAVELALFSGRWIHRPVSQPGQAEGPWKPLCEGQELDCGGRLLKASSGSYTHF